MEKRVFRQLSFGLLGILIVGTVGYWQIEHWSFLDSFFMTVITITTVGYREVGGELSSVGKIFTVLLIFSGFGVAALALSHFTSAILKGELNNILGRMRMRREIDSIKEHYIIAGFGRTGQVIATSFRLKKIPFVVIDSDDKAVRIFDELNIPYIIGDAGDEDVLKKAGIERAKGFVAVVSSDASNAFAIMTARVLNTGLTIIARALDVQSIRKLKIAGANKVIAPYQLGGARIAHAIAHPHASDFIDIVEDVESEHIEMADLLIKSNSRFDGKTVGDSVFTESNVIVVGIRRSNGEFVFHPKANQDLKVNDHLIIMGPTKNIEQLYQMVT